MRVFLSIQTLAVELMRRGTACIGKTEDETLEEDRSELRGRRLALARQTLEAILESGEAKSEEGTGRTSAVCVGLVARQGEGGVMSERGFESSRAEETRWIGGGKEGVPRRPREEAQLLQRAIQVSACAAAVPVEYVRSP